MECRTCAFAQKKDVVRVGEMEMTTTFNCRRNPPQIVTGKVNAISFAESHTEWPTVSGDDWCGEYQQFGTQGEDE